MITWDFRLFIGPIIWADIYMPSWSSEQIHKPRDCIPDSGICTLCLYPSLIGAFSLRTEKISMIIWLWGDVLRIFGRRADYLNREKLVTLFKHFRGILSLKKFLEAFFELLDPPVSPLSWELDSEENESEEPLFSLSTPKYLPQFFLTLILS